MDALVASRLAAAVRDPDVVARVLPHLPRPLVSRGSGEGERSRGDGWASPSSSAGRPTRVAVGISGGVDSAVAAWLLKSAGFDVTGVLMRNWDEAEETGGACEFEKDQRDARAVAAALDVELKEVDFVREYWHAVFEPFLRDFERGNATPNPDLACNRHIKFGALLRHCEEALGADVLATGHYARVAPTGDHETGNDANESRLLRGVDETKDQSYFLASVRGASLRRACFPLGGLTKKQVRALASGPARLPAAVTARRSSAGICHVGRKQNFGDFIAQYGDASSDASSDASFVPGAFVSVDDGRVIGTHTGLSRYTVGQRARVGGARVPWYVVGKDASPGRERSARRAGPGAPSALRSRGGGGRVLLDERFRVPAECVFFRQTRRAAHRADAVRGRARGVRSQAGAERRRAGDSTDAVRTEKKRRLGRRRLGGALRRADARAHAGTGAGAVRGGRVSGRGLGAVPGEVIARAGDGVDSRASELASSGYRFADYVPIREKTHPPRAARVSGSSRSGTRARPAPRL